MLNKSARLTSSSDFARATKSGLRVATDNFVGYLYLTGSDQSAKAGLIISKSVGGSVVRHRIARQARHAIAADITKLPQGSLFVLRANSKAATADFGIEISQILNRLIDKSAKVAQ